MSVVGEGAVVVFGGPFDWSEVVGLDVDVVVIFDSSWVASSALVVPVWSGGSIVIDVVVDDVEVSV